VIPKVLGTNLQRERTRKRVSVENLADKAGYSAEFVQKIESGEAQDLKLADAESLADALGVELTTLLKRPD
jgi:transcriptional regulator with XRE-family HTH domain